jgi:hypothetical protein
MSRCGGSGDTKALRCLKCVERSGRINEWRSPNELDHLLELDGGEFSHDLLNASLMEQQDSRDDGFGHALSGGPARIVGMKKKVKTIRHAQE